MTLGVVDDHGVDVGVGTHDAQTRASRGAKDLAADTALTTLEAGALCLLLVHVKLLMKSCQHLTGCWSYDVEALYYLAALPSLRRMCSPR